MEQLTFFDIEILNNDPASICSIGIIVLKDQQIIKQYYSLIKPQNMSFDYFRYEIHHIRPRDLKKAKSFKEVWKEISIYFEGQIVLSHDVQSDMSHLRAVLRREHISYPQLYMSCTNVIAHILEPELSKYNITELCQYFHIPIVHAHNALDDALACTQIYLAMMNKYGYKSLADFHQKNHLALGEMKTNYYRNIISPDLADVSNHLYSHPLSLSCVTFAGELASDKDIIDDYMKEAHLFVSRDVNTHTDYLVIGDIDFKKIRYNHRNRKVKKALHLINEGQDLHIIKEHDFLNLLKSE